MELEKERRFEAKLASYQNPATTGLISMASGALDYSTAQKGSLVYCVINLIAMLASVPLWQMMGLC